MRLNPVLEQLAVYPFTRLTAAKQELIARGVDVVDFGTGEPREATPPFIREAFVAAVTPLSTYPLAAGLTEYREAAAAWVERRFGAVLDPETELIPTLGSKEAIFHLVHLAGPGAVVVTEPGYPVAERSAAFDRRAVVRVALRARDGFLPDLDAIPWRDAAIVWLNYPNNPTAATAPLELYERAAALAREHDVILASDEAYSELYFGGDPPVSALQIADRGNLVVCHTLSKRSSMPGYRIGFTAGDPALIAALKRYRPNVGVAPQEVVQRAGIAAWGDEAHVGAVRDVYRAKREVVLPALEAAGLRNAGGDATFFLWLQAPERTAAELLERGIVVAPGEFFGEAGRGYVRVALVPTLDECRLAARRLTGWRAGSR